MSNQIKTMNIMKTYLYTTIAIIATAICMTSNLYAADAPANLKMKSTSALLDPVQALPTQIYQRHTHSKHANYNTSVNPTIYRTSNANIQSVGAGEQYNQNFYSAVNNHTKTVSYKQAVPAISQLPLPQRVKKMPLAAAEGTILADEQLALNRIAPRQNARGEEGDIIEDPTHTPDPNQPLPDAIGYLLLLSIMYILKRKYKKIHVHEA
jgi:hypothetical protein